MNGSGLQRELTRSKKVEAALNNEMLTRQRVERLERDLTDLARRLAPMQSALQGHLHLRFWGRLRWLVTGR